MSSQQVFPLLESGIQVAKRLQTANSIFSATSIEGFQGKIVKLNVSRLPKSIFRWTSFSHKRNFNKLSAGLYSSNFQAKLLNSASNSGSFERGFRSKSGPSANTNSKVDEVVDQTVKAYNLPEKSAFAVRVGFLEGFATSGSAPAKKKSLGRSLFTLGIATFVAYQTMRFIRSRISDSGEKQRFKAVDEGAITNVRFADVCGVDEAKEELSDVVRYLQNPDSFTNIGAKLPKGILLVGPPGTGKTLLAKAVAGEAGVPFFYAAGSEFEEMFVGVGAQRVRQLFEAARAQAPAIIFIDEIDACGSTRTNNTMQPYARQTINQLLQEMDGFNKSEPIIVLAATNSPEVLDKALTRPGRFDSQVTVSLPDIEGRKKTLELYLSRLSSIQNLDSLDIDRLSSLTGGMSGADISNVVNQAALQAAKNGKSLVSQEDLEFAYDKIKMGPELKSRIRSETELMNTAYHEAGHALVAYYTPAAWDIYKATIRQRGMALGHVAQLPSKESENGQTKEELMAQMNVAMGGRVAEELLYGSDKVTTGASSDIQAATRIAYLLVCDMGMSDKLGLMKYDLGSVSEDTKRTVEVEVKSFLQNSYEEAKKLLVCRQKEHKLLATALIRYETLTMDEIKVLIESGDLDSIHELREENDKKSKNNKPPGIVLGPLGVPMIDLISKPPSAKDF